MEKYEAYTAYLAERELEALLFSSKIVVARGQQSFTWESNQGEDVVVREGDDIQVDEFRKRYDSWLALDSFGFVDFIEKPLHDKDPPENKCYLNIRGPSIYRYKYETRNWFVQCDVPPRIWSRSNDRIRYEWRHNIRQNEDDIHLNKSL